MTDKKISELTSITGANVSDANDVLPIVDTSVATTKKITRAELFKSVSSVDINGGTIDGTVIGGSTPAAISGTTGSFSGNLTVDTNTLFVDAANNRVGIGTSSPFNDTGYTAIDIRGSTGGQINFGTTSTRYGQISSNATNGLVFNTTAAIPMLFFTYGIERMRIDSSGNVGIGSTDPQAALDLGEGAQGRGITWAGLGGSARYNNIFSSYSGAGLVLSSMFHGSTSADSYVTSYTGTTRAAGIRLNWTNNNGIQFFTDTAAAKTAGNAFVPSERMRINSSGNLLVGTTSDIGGLGGMVQIASGGNRGIVQSINANVRMQEYLVSGATVGFISNNGTTTTYATSSDYRLKENVAPMQNALATVAQLNPVTHTWKVDGSAGQGFIAHELQAVVPDCVTGEKDAVDADGNPQYQGVDTSFLVATLVKAIQEQQATIEALEARITALEAQP